MAGSVWVKVFPPEPAGGGGGIGWAALDGGTVTSYTDGDGVAWNVHTFNASADVVVSSPGLVRGLLVSGGGGATNLWGEGGMVWEGLIFADEGTHPVTVGGGGADATTLGGGASTVLSARALSSFAGTPQGVNGGRGAGWIHTMGITPAALVAGWMSSIAGTVEEYGRGMQTGQVPRPNRGDGNRGSGLSGSAGVVILSVPQDPSTPVGRWPR